MKGVFIRGQAMPDNCYDCPFNYDLMYCVCDSGPTSFPHKNEEYLTGRDPRCPLISPPGMSQEVLDALEEVRPYGT